MKKRIFITPEDKITQYENNLVTLKLKSGEIFENLEPRRLFPVSNLYQYITLISNEGKEIAVIRDLKDLSKESLDVIKQSLDDYYLVPYISQIVSVTEKSGITVWNVKTNRGDMSFEIRSRNHDIKVYKSGQIRFRDSHDNRYVIEDYKTLDKHSKRLISPDL